MEKSDFIKKCKAVNTGNYGMGSEELFEFLLVAEYAKSDAIIAAFNFGFQKGQRAEATKRRKAAKGAA